MLVPDGRLDPAQPRHRARVHLLGELLQQALHAARVGPVVGLAGQTLLDAVDRHLQPVALGGLQDVVDDALLEGFDRVLVVGRDEHDLAAAPRLGVAVDIAFVDRQLADRARRFDAVHSGHADVEKHQVGPMRLDQRDCLGAVLRFADDVQLGPDLEQARAQLIAQQPLVVGDDGGRHAAAA